MQAEAVAAPAAEPQGKKREILLYPDDLLRGVSVWVGPTAPETAALVRDLIATAKAAKAAGLSAPQIGEPKRVVVIEEGGVGSGKFRAFINPVIVDASPTTQVFREGCLSFPGAFENVTRPDEVTVQALGLDGARFETVFTGIEAEAIQHEVDHLDGRLLIDRVQVHRRDTLRMRMKQMHRRLKRLRQLQHNSATVTEILFGFRPEV